MLVFNTTYLVSDKVYGIWLKWVVEQHIPFMLNSAVFSKPQVAKVLADEDQDGTSFSVQFHVQDMETLKRWAHNYSEIFKSDFGAKFGTEALFFSTTLELMYSE